MALSLSPKERAKLKLLIKEITDSFLRIDSERETIKDMIADAAEEFDIEKKMIRKIANAMYKSNYPDIVSEQEDFEFLYESIIEGKDANDSVVTPIRAKEGS